jgi:hypothetical protein
MSKVENKSYYIVYINVKLEMLRHSFTKRISSDIMRQQNIVKITQMKLISKL